MTAPIGIAPRSWPAGPDALFRPRSLYLAAVLARLAEPRLAAGEGIAPGALRPLYLRPADIRRSGA